jgi:hypothetical protein
MFKLAPLRIHQNARFAFRLYSTASPLTLERLDGAEKGKHLINFNAFIFIHLGISIIHLHKPDTKNAISKLMLTKVKFFILPTTIPATLAPTFG